MTFHRRDAQADADSGLLAAARLGDERAFGQLVEHHRRALELYCELMLGCPERAREAVRETLLRGWCARDHVDPQASARIWLYRLATGVCLGDPDRSDYFR
jgi:RNA polymerase sigma-70 factor, ECF subfamily